MQKYRVRAYLQTSYFMGPVMAKSDDDALKRALLQFDRKFGLGAADELVLYFNVCPVEEEDE